MTARKGGPGRPYMLNFAAKVEMVSSDREFFAPVATRIRTAALDRESGSVDNRRCSPPRFPSHAGPLEQRDFVMKHHERRIDDVVVVELKGKLTLGGGDVQLRQIVNDLLERGETKILLDLGGVGYMDSAGTGELVAAYTSASNKGGEVKLLNLTSKTRELLQFTQLISVFEDFNDVAEAVHSFNE